MEYISEYQQTLESMLQSKLPVDQHVAIQYAVDLMDDMKPSEHDDVDYHERKKKDWFEPDHLDTYGSMLLEPFSKLVSDAASEGSSHGVPTVSLRLFDKKTKTYIYADIKWVEFDHRIGCGCPDGITIVAETD